MKKRESGFTLMEIILVMVIISIMFGFAVPRLDSFLTADKSKKGVRLFNGFIRELKISSLKKTKDFLLVIDPDSDSFWIEPEKDNEPDKKNLGKDIDISGVQTGTSDYSTTKKTYIRFYSKGYNDPFIVILKNRKDDKIFSIAVHPFLTEPAVYDKPHFFEDGFS
jgi:prepilin-type N-terminal cleavage/methylation domain-containing protein